MPALGLEVSAASRARRSPPPAPALLNRAALNGHWDGSERRGRSPGLLSRSIGAALAHEIRTPLAGIRAAAQLMSLQGGGDLSLASLIVEEVDRLSRMVSTYSPACEPPVRTAVDVPALLARGRELLGAMFPEVTFEVTSPDESALAWADHDQLTQVFLNLLKNAAEAALAGSGRRRVLAAVSFDAGPGGRQLVVLVRDDGPGVPDSLLPKLFTPYATTKPGGTGLGLCVCRELLTLNGGGVALRSRPGETDFVVTLPCAPAAADRRPDHGRGA